MSDGEDPATSPDQPSDADRIGELERALELTRAQLGRRQEEAYEEGRRLAVNQVAAAVLSDSESVALPPSASVQADRITELERQLEAEVRKRDEAHRRMVEHRTEAEVLRRGDLRVNENVPILALLFFAAFVAGIVGLGLGRYAVPAEDRPPDPVHCVGPDPVPVRIEPVPADADLPDDVAWQVVLDDDCRLRSEEVVGSFLEALTAAREAATIESTTVTSVP